MAKYDITKEAREDLFRIWEYTVDTWSEDQADKYYAVLTSALEKIASARKKPGNHMMKSSPTSGLSTFVDTWFSFPYRKTDEP